jgi:hypothetical protein
MKALFDWIKANLLVVVLLFVILFLATRQNGPIPLSGAMPFGIGGASPEFGVAKMGLAQSSADIMPYQPQAPPTDQANRLVVRDTSLSLVSSDVAGTLRQIESQAVSLGGYMVDSNLSQPEGAASGTISVRVPTEKRTEAIDAFKKFAIKTVSESVSGTDVTDQYVDIQARMDVLTKTKAKFEEILAKAEKVQDLLDVQRELTNIQSQIDSLKGQQKYLEQTAKLTKITTYISTDELALPYTPDQPWRPSVIFKEAVRSLVGSVRGVGSALIWIGVYAPIWLPILIVFWWIKRKHA